jgi:non-specific serine/threonine protein kinase
VAWSLNGLGAVALATGETVKAWELVAEALTLRREQCDKRGVAESLELLASIMRTGGEAERGARLLGAAAALREAIGTPLWPVERERQERERASASHALGRARFDAAWAAGRQMTLAAAVADALAGVTVPSALVTVVGVAQAPVSPLTPREREVATLVANGYTNRQIAETLIISAHTAERHVERILAKLGCSSRAEIATWAASHEPASQPA